MSPPSSTTANLNDGGATVAVTVLTPFIRLLEEAGAEMVTRAAERSEAVFARWGIKANELAPDPTLRLPHGLVVELHDVFIDVLGDPSAPLRAGTKLRRGDYDLLEYLCASCSTLGESIACLGRYYPLLISAEMELIIEGDRAEARFRIAPGLAAPDSFHEFGLASNFWMSILHLSLEGAQPLIEVCFAHPAPEYADVFASVFLAPVRFEQPYNALVFPLAQLNQPMKAPDPVLHAVLTRQADQELAAIADLSVFPSKVRAAIEAELSRGASLEAVAEHLCLSPSAVRSRLAKHGTSFSDLVDRMRRDYAKRALRQSQLSIAEIGHALGFAHPPAFHRAFRRWFGVTPSEFREAPQSNPAAAFFGRKG
jgi:AraC-like DNA-binding protein